MGAYNRSRDGALKTGRGSEVERRVGLLRHVATTTRLGECYLRSLPSFVVRFLGCRGGGGAAGSASSAPIVARGRARVFPVRSCSAIGGGFVARVGCWIGRGGSGVAVSRTQADPKAPMRITRSEAIRCTLRLFPPAFRCTRWIVPPLYRDSLDRPAPTT